MSTTTTTPEHLGVSPKCLTILDGTLYNRDNRLAMLYRIQNDLVNINRTQYLTGGDSRTRGAHKFYQQRITHDVYYNSFFPRTIRDWNTLPATVADAWSLKDFHLRLQATH